MVNYTLEEFSNTFIKTAAKTLTSVSTPVIAKGVWVDYMLFTNTDSSARAVTVKDGNGTVIISAVSIVASGGDPYQFPLPEGGLYFENGVYWSADQTAKVTALIRMRYA